MSEQLFTVAIKQVKEELKHRLVVGDEYLYGIIAFNKQENFSKKKQGMWESLV